MFAKIFTIAAFAAAASAAETQNNFGDLSFLNSEGAFKAAQAARAKFVAEHMRRVAHRAHETMKYFNIGDKQCRGLQFDKQLLGSNKEKLLSHNVFVRSIPKELGHSDLQKKFEGVGKIKSLKVSLNGDHTSRGYGFICF